MTYALLSCPKWLRYISRDPCCLLVDICCCWHMQIVGLDTWHHEDNPNGSTVEMHGNIR